MYNFFKNINIGKKILIAILFICIASQTLIGSIAFDAIRNLGIYSKEIASDLGNRISGNSETVFQNHTKSYLKKIANSISDLSDSNFKQIGNEVTYLANSIEHSYDTAKDRIVFGSIPRLHQNKNGTTKTDKIHAEPKGYVIDTNNSNENAIFVYDSDFYNHNESLYKIDNPSFQILSDEQKADLINNYTLTSGDKIPQKLELEMKFIDTFKYYIKSIYDGNDSISSIYIGTESGIVYEYSCYELEHKFDPKTRPWYRDAVEMYKNGNDSAVWQNKYYSLANGQQCITVSKVYNDSNGNIVGVIAIDMYIDDVQAYVSDSKIGETGYAFILDNSGQVVMSSDNNNPDIFSEYPLNSEIDDTYKNVLINMTLGEEGFSEIIVSGKKYYISYAPMKTTGWSMGIMTEVNEVMSPMTTAHTFVEDKINESQKIINSEINTVVFKFFAILFFMLCVVMLIGTWLSNQIVKPLKNLKNGAKKIGSGNLSVRFITKSNDEVGELASTFNKMTCDLQSYMDNLEFTTREKEKIHNELNVAKKIQLSMLPCIFPAFPDRNEFDIYALMDPAKEVGGDFYDFFFIDEENLAIVIADVSGKGVSAALFMVIAKTLIKNQAQSGSLPGEIFEIVNNQLCENNDAGMFVTAFMGIFNIKTGKLIYSNAGHNPPVVYRASDDKIEWIKSKHSFVLAGLNDIKYKNEEIYLSKNDVLYMYTDGVTEATNNDNEMYSDDRLEKTLCLPDVKNMCVKDSINYLRKSIEIFCDGAERSDDITILGFKVGPLDNKNKP